MLVLSEPGTGPLVQEQVVIDDYMGEIYFKAGWQDGEYLFEWALHENGEYMELARLKGDVLLSRGYTGAYLGLYATANGNDPGDHADFDWVMYRVIEAL